jgi:hypothetical protein
MGLVHICRQAIQAWPTFKVQVPPFSVYYTHMTPLTMCSTKTRNRLSRSLQILKMRLVYAFFHLAPKFPQKIQCMI